MFYFASVCVLVPTAYPYGGTKTQKDINKRKQKASQCKSKQ